MSTLIRYRLNDSLDFRLGHTPRMQLLRHFADCVFTTFLTTFFTALLPAFRLGEDQLVVSIPFRSHVVLVFYSFFGCKCSNFSRFKQQLEDFLLEFSRPLSSHTPPEGYNTKSS